MDTTYAPRMGNPTPHRDSWGSASSTCSHLEMSFSHDSCYGSDEVSVTSAGTNPAQSNTSTFPAKPPLHPFLKSILKNSSTAVESEEESDSESGYSSDGDSEYDALSDEEYEDEDDGDASDFSIWDETSRDVPETHEDHTESFDDAFISFEENAVRFAANVQYIDSAEVSDDEENADTQMTCHEMMLLALKSNTQSTLDQLDAMDINDSDDDEDPHEFLNKVTTKPEEFSRDAVDLDRSLFVAYMNGMHGIADTKFKSYLRNQVDHIRLGQEADTMGPDGSSSLYLDLISSHVIGTFCNLLTQDELNDLIIFRAEEQPSKTNDSTLNLDHHNALLDRIEQFLLDRLTNGHVDVGPDELSFFAGMIAHDLGTKPLPAQN
ncbi:hypothetical protein N7499_010536 [Penicillium canescens]|nr:hypothetical protein N7522_010218 [Penicillium canescens]KAJ6068649.1 hypothetical protein N7499_010536 [Penicillium canescens]KAJ6183298.1 hypothetical protein N7485_001940 [Penicillium canescens]